MADGGTLAGLATEIGRALATLRPALDSPAAFQGLALRLGWDLDTIPAPIQGLAGALATLEGALAPVFAGGEPSAAEIEALIAAVRATTLAIAALSSASFDPALMAAGFAAEFPLRLIELVVVEYLLRYHPRLAFAAKALGLVREVHVPRAGTRPGYLRREIVWVDFGRLLDDPVLLLQNAYGWRTADFDAHGFVRAVGDLVATAAKIDVRLAQLPDTQAERIEEAGPLPGRPVRWHLDAPLYADTVADAPVEAGVRLLPLPATGPHLPGLALLPYAVGSFGDRFPLDAHLAFTLRSAVDLSGGVALRVRPGEPLDLIIGYAGDSPSQASGRISGRIDYGGDPDVNTHVLVGSATGTRLEATSLSGVGALTLDAASPPELSIELELGGGRFVLAAGEGDSFLRHLLPAGGLAATFDLAVGLSNERGLYFRGSGGLTATVPIHVAVGPVAVDSLTLAVTASGAGFPVELGLTLRATLGPITATVKGVGLRASFTFPGHGGNLGPVDVDVGFKPPDGIGLAVGGAGFSGGGFIDLEPASGSYRGLLALAFADRVALTGVGLLDTRLPDGSDGFSLYIAISARFGPIPLGMGFTLNGAGGLIGLNRTVRLDVLRAGVKDGSLAALFFPADPVASASATIAGLERVFPAQNGRTVFGPVARLGWGTPTLLTADVGLVIEVPDPVRLAVLGVVRARLPDADAPLLVLQVDFLGTVDLDKKQLAFDASLFDSRLLAFRLDGDLALRLSWGDEPTFLFSVGGFHPAFTPPPMDLPDLRRVAISLLGGDNPRLRAEAYFAVTSNTVQVGAQVELYAAVSRFNLHGFLGFDVLIELSPFHFSAEVKASLAVRIGDDALMSVDVDFTLEGPAPWHAQGSAHFEICWFLSFTVSFDTTWGDATAVVLADVDVLPRLAAALADPSSWRAALPVGAHALVALRGAGDELVVDPAGSLTVSQKVVPLELTIARFGSVKPRDATRFSISVTSGTSVLPTTPVTEEFAPAQFLDLDDAAKLSRPSFERYPSGVTIGGGDSLVADRVLGKDVAYEQIVIDRVSAGRPAGRRPLAVEVFTGLIAAGAISRSPLARNARFTPSAPALAVVAESFTVVSQVDLTPASGARAGLSHAEAVEEMARLVAAAPDLAGALQVVPSYEAAA